MEENKIVTQMLEALNDSPLVDPAWGYSEIYTRCYSVKQSLEKLVGFIGDIESSTPETDRAIREYLDQIGQHLNITRRMLDE